MYSIRGYAIALALTLANSNGYSQQNTQPEQGAAQQVQPAQTTLAGCAANAPAPRKPSWLEKHVHIGAPAIAQRALNKLGQQTGIVINPGTVPLAMPAKAIPGTPCPLAPANATKQ